MDIQEIATWPGKTYKELPGAEHPAVYHMLDVAAVAEILVLKERMSRKLADAVILLVALHDIGKISDSFCNMLRSGDRQIARHWELSEVILYLNDELISSVLGSEPRRRQHLYAATAGHHGRPPEGNVGNVSGPRPRQFNDMTGYVGQDGLTFAEKVIREFLGLWPEASLDEVASLSQAKSLSWWLSGFCSVADWIGSNKDWFPPCSEVMSLRDYLGFARSKAAIAVEAAGLSGAEILQGPVFDFRLRPMQAACQNISIPDGPTLAIIEDETGAGKTEAAIMLAHRMMLEGKGRGFFFALPTMATADAMFVRMTNILNRMFLNPTVTLSHGRSGLSVPFRDMKAAWSQPGGNSMTCSDWLFDDRRRSLLSDVGVGTIDQAIKSVLPVKWQAIRHYGLSSKIIIVDEVHEMGEAYIAEEVASLLKMHRDAGGSAILMTATLPLCLREKLLNTYGCSSSSAAYPSLIVSGSEPVTDFQDDGRAKKGLVKVERIESVDDAVSIICEKAGMGAACAWIRNSVDEAIASVDLLQSFGVNAKLLHSRFTLQDRKDIEHQIQSRVGKDGIEREGFVLVSTQIIESSLDLDFDVMVSDLAPVAAIIQRAGRLWRHVDIRPPERRPVPAPVLYILSPDPDQISDTNWLREVIGKGSLVYASSDTWRSAKVLFSTGYIDAPDGLREMIEAVHGEGAEPVPPILLSEDMKNNKKNMESQNKAWQNIVTVEHGYRASGRDGDEDDYPTRLGEETCTIALARITENGLVPWANGSDFDGWRMSEISIRRSLLRKVSPPDQSNEEISTAKKGWKKWMQTSIRIFPVDASGSICEGLRYDSQSGLVFS